jgi:hypothetical protein
MTPVDERGVLRVAPAGYFIAFLLVVTPAFDWVTNITPFRPGSVDWRYGVTGLLSGFLLTPLLGMAVAALISAATGGRRARLVTGVLNLAFGLALVLLLPLFALDFFQLRASMPAGELSLYDVAGLKAAVKHLTAAAAFLWLGVAVLRNLPRAVRKRAAALAVVMEPPAQPIV